MCRQARNSWSWGSWIEKPGVFQVKLFVPYVSVLTPSSCSFPFRFLSFPPAASCIVPEGKGMRVCTPQLILSCLCWLFSQKIKQKAFCLGYPKVLLSRVDTQLCSARHCLKYTETNIFGTFIGCTALHSLLISFSIEAGTEECIHVYWRSSWLHFYLQLLHSFSKVFKEFLVALLNNILGNCRKYCSDMRKSCEAMLNCRAFRLWSASQSSLWMEVRPSGSTSERYSKQKLISELSFSVFFFLFAVQELKPVFFDFY